MRALVLLTIIVNSLIALDAKSEKQVVDLRGTWKFELGDNRTYAEPSYDDSKWDEIFVPANWENEGYPGYDGYAWYRRSFVLPASVKGKSLLLSMGYVDDVCGVYINGTLIGEGGRFEPDYQTGYNIEQKFILPEDILKYGKENTIAVRVYDAMQGGGIVRGRVGILEQRSDIDYIVRFPVRWKLQDGDDPDWKRPEFNDRSWRDVIVPAKWDFQGLRNYDGYGWYRVTFDAPMMDKNARLVVLLGKIDDVDETYLNGERIGRTGRVRSNGSISSSNDYQKIRAYEIAGSALKPKGNVLAVRVYDGLMDGGIYEGPVGIVSLKTYERMDLPDNAGRTLEVTPFERLIDKIFNKQ